MSDRKLAVLGVIAVLMAGWAVLQNRISQNVNTVDFSSSPLITGLQIEAVAGITVTSDKGQKTTTLNRTGGGFVVANKDNYPVDVSRINNLINSCLDIRIHEKVTDNPDNHADLGVTDETAQSRVSFLDKEGAEIVGMLVSKSGEKGGAFVRLVSGNDVYSIQSPPRIPTGAIDYVDPELLRIEQNKMQSVAVQTSGDSYVLAASEDKASVELQDMPAGKQYKGTDYKSVFGALNSLQFDNVVSEGNAPEALKFDSSYTCTLEDKTVYRLQLAQKDEKTYAKVSADYLDKTPVKKTVGEVESEEELKAKEAKLLATDAVKAFNQKHQGWVYEIPSYKAGELTKPLSELLEDVPEPEPQPTADPDAAG
ncbi:MAG: DUF4340 domain-containing protein [Planctomycetota bacterium]